MEHKVTPASSEPQSTRWKRTLGLATLALSSVACKATDLLTSPDPLFSFVRGAAGTALLEAELGMGRGVDYALNKTTNIPLGCLTLIGAAAPPIIVGALAAEYPAVGYAALAIPVVVGLIHLGGGRHRE